MILNIMLQRPRICVLVLLISAFLWFGIFYFDFGVPKPILVNHDITKNLKPDSLEVFPIMQALRSVDNKSDPCGGRYVYVHDIPSRFNKDIVKECGRINKFCDMCKLIINNGFGPALNNTEGVLSDNGWYATSQFTLDLIFNTRMKQYECLTNDSSMAAAIFVPFYAGFDCSKYLYGGYNISVRDAASLELVDWLQKRDEWKVMNGKDHFLVGGRITWNFRRGTEDESASGNNFLNLPAARNMSMLLIESSPWDSNDFSIPYPTYFHPSRDSDVFNWQYQVMQLDRKWLFSFVGAPRPNNPYSIRNLLIDQCKNSSVGKHLECGDGEINCYSPSNIMNTFRRSVFCLQPPGDSATRRSAFDSILAGCIPVFFHQDSFYTQYTWHVPINHTKYSVFISEDDIRKNVSIEQRLSQIDPVKIKLMRKEVINLIPKLIYAPSRLDTIKDAFDVSVEAIINKVAQLRQNMIYERRNDNSIDKVS